MSSKVLRKKEIFTICSPIPGFIPRKLAIDVLHTHDEVITLNPLVISHVQIVPPKNIPPEEYSCIWYEITERIQYVPGLGKMGSGKINFNGCFLDAPWGLQTHIYAPMGVDLRANYHIAGNQPGIEPVKQRELGLEAAGAPPEGLYLRADLEFESNIALASFVRSQLKATIKEMVNRIVKRAEALDADVLQGMIRGQQAVPTATPTTQLKGYEPVQHSQSEAFRQQQPHQYPVYETLKQPQTTEVYNSSTQNYPYRQDYQPQASELPSQTSTYPLYQQVQHQQQQQQQQHRDQQRPRPVSELQANPYSKNQNGPVELPGRF